MKSISMQTVLALLVCSPNAALAAAGTTEHGNNGILIWLCIGFGVMIVLFQAAPALVTFLATIKGLFSTSPSAASFSPWKNKDDL